MEAWNEARATVSLRRLHPHGAPKNAAALIVVGLAADEAQSARLWAAAGEVREGLIDRGIPAEAITLLPAKNDATLRRDAFVTAAAAVTPAAAETWLVLLGNAAPARDGRPAFQVSGPRVTVDDLCAVVRALPGQKFVVVGTTRGGAFLPALLAVPQVEAVAATAEAGEVNEPRFPQLWAQALAAHPEAPFRELAADAAARVDAYYRARKIGQGEHAQWIDRATGQIGEVPATPISPAAPTEPK